MFRSRPEAAAEMRRARGRDAEQRALDFLRSHGLAPVARNWRCRAGELDLVMRDGDTLVVVEVRRRSHRGYGSAAESVTFRKQQRIVRATRLYLMQHPHLATQPLRFDIVGIDADGKPEWLRAAFEVNE
jgi:putative endonuclease